MIKTSEPTTVEFGSFRSPLGVVSYAHSQRGVLAMGFVDDPTTIDLGRRPIVAGGFHQSAGVDSSLTQYFDGRFEALDDIDIDEPSTGFYAKCRTVLRTVRSGTTVSYSALASMSGNPKAYRAAATACSSNPIALIIPCHRVLGSNGRVGRYAYGSDLKAALLRHEGAAFIGA